MAREINSLLNKTTWKGEEVGRAVILSFIHDYENRGNPKAKPLFTQADMNRMSNGLASDYDGKVYNQYVTLHNGIVEEYNRAQGLYQQAQNGYYRMLIRLTGAQQADNAKRILSHMPAIVTEKQYIDITTEETNKKRAFKESYQSLIFQALNYYLGQVAGTEPKVPKAIKDALEALKNEPVTNPDILEHISRDWGDGYYTLPDGRRSDDYEKEEWQAILKEEYLKTHKLTIEGHLQDYEETMRYFNQERIIQKHEAIFNGQEPADESTLPSRLKSAFDLEWHYYDEPPEDLTKWDVVAGEWSMLERYSGASGDEDKYFKAFIADFPGLFAALKKDIASKKGLEETSKIKAANYGKDFITWGELADLGVYGYPVLVDTDHYTFLEGYNKRKDHTRRAFMNGVAVLKEGSYTDSDVDENGYYEEPKMELLSLFSGVEALSKDEDELEELEGARTVLLLPALRGIEAYNTMLDILAERFKINELPALKQDLSQLYGQIKAYNMMVATFYTTVFGDEEEKARRRELIKEIFIRVDLDTIKPTAAAIESVKEKLQKPAPLDAETRIQLLTIELASSREEGE